MTQVGEQLSYINFENSDMPLGLDPAQESLASRQQVKDNALLERFRRYVPRELAVATLRNLTLKTPTLAGS